MIQEAIIPFPPPRSDLKAVNTKELLRNYYVKPAHSPFCVACVLSKCLRMLDVALRKWARVEQPSQ